MGEPVFPPPTATPGGEGSSMPDVAAALDPTRGWAALLLPAVPVPPAEGATAWSVVPPPPLLPLLRLPWLTVLWLRL